MSRLERWRIMMVWCVLVPVCCFGEAGRFPSVDKLPKIRQLPNPFKMNDGSRVATIRDWQRRREEILALLLHYEYGHPPPPPDNLKCEVVSSVPALDGKATLRRVVMTMGPEHKLKANAGLYVPSRGTGPFPVLLAIDPVWEPSLETAARHAVDQGFIFAGYDSHDFDQDSEDRSDGAHPLYPEYDWATLAVWAWGALRMVDYLMTCPEVQPDHIALTGHSRRGKTALLAAALDTRIALVAPHCSGAGGAGCFRILGVGSESLESITHPNRFHYWFQPRLREFARKENRLPFDQHFLKALVAPRCIVSIEGLEDHWANPLGTQQVWRATQPVFDFLGVPERNVLHVRPGGHDTTEEDWLTLLDYCDHFFFGKPLKTPTPLIPFPDAPRPFSWKAPKPT